MSNFKGVFLFFLVGGSGLDRKTRKGHQLGKYFKGHSLNVAYSIQLNCTLQVMSEL